MKRLNLITAVPALACVAFTSATVFADDALDDLDATMIVVDDARELDASIAEIADPDDDDVRNEDWEDNERGKQIDDAEPGAEEPQVRKRDKFEDEVEGDDAFDHDNEEEEALEIDIEQLDDGDLVDDDIEIPAGP